MCARTITGTLNHITHGLSAPPLTHGGGGIKTQVTIKVIGPPKTHVKIYLFSICFIGLNGYLDTFRKSQKVWTLNFDLFGVKQRVGSGLGLYGPPVSNRVMYDCYKRYSRHSVSVGKGKDSIPDFLNVYLFFVRIFVTVCYMISMCCLNLWNCVLNGKEYRSCVLHFMFVLHISTQLWITWYLFVAYIFVTVC